jgi:hypothetical protein
MRTLALVAVTVVLATTMTGCLRAGPPKTPNQREAEREARRTSAPPPLPAPAREPPPFRER